MSEQGIRYATNANEDGDRLRIAAMRTPTEDVESLSLPTTISFAARQFSSRLVRLRIRQKEEEEDGREQLFAAVYYLKAMRCSTDKDLANVHNSDLCTI